MFGDTTQAGALSIVESIYGDPKNDILLLAEEDTTQSSVKIYNLSGNFTGKSFGMGIFHYQVEGITLVKDGEEGYWIITDQSHQDNRFHIFTRNEFKHRGSFSGPNTTNTDGVWMTQKSFGPFEQGAFYAIHNDGNVSAFDWNQIKSSLNLK
jgi:3-phytase